MSTDIKPGDWQDATAVVPEVGDRVTLENGDRLTRFVVDHQYDGSLYDDNAERYDLTGQEPEWRVVRIEQPVKPDATPAPLDPSAVAITLKAGDRIEAESDGTKIGGPVSHVNENGFVSIQHLGSFAIEGITPPRTGYRMFTLTAYQPAPEPEVEWKPGTVGTATLTVGADEGSRRIVVRLTGNEYALETIPLVWADLDGNRYAEAEVTDFVPDEPRPLPTRDEIADAMHDDYLPGGSPRLGTTARRVLADAVLALLRGESR